MKDHHIMRPFTIDTQGEIIYVAALTKGVLITGTLRCGKGGDGRTGT